MSSINMEVQLNGKELLVFGIEGDFTFREGLFTYISKTTKLKSAGRPPLSVSRRSLEASRSSIDLEIFREWRAGKTATDGDVGTCVAWR